MARPAGGGSANPITIRLPISGGELSVPTWIQLMPDGRLLEDNGVSPDIEVAPGQDCLTAALAALHGR
jgi:C-terminal processing protease CtpA/Prc